MILARKQAYIKAEKKEGYCKPVFWPTMRSMPGPDVLFAGQD